jgi:hypothetical protein
MMQSSFWFAVLWRAHFCAFSRKDSAGVAELFGRHFLASK